MKRYKMIQEHIAKLEAEDKKLELALDDAFENYTKTTEKKAVASYMDKLREQRKEIDIRLRVNHELITYKGATLQSLFGGDDGYLLRLWVYDSDIDLFYDWLASMVEEV